LQCPCLQLALVLRRCRFRRPCRWLRSIRRPRLTLPPFPLRAAVDRAGTAGLMAVVVQCSTALPAGIPVRLAAIASATGNLLFDAFSSRELVPASLENANNKKPRFPAGFSYRAGFSAVRSDRTATSIAPGKPERAGTAGNDHHRPLDHDCTRNHHHVGTVRTASAVGAAMEADAATAFGASAAETCNRACNQSSCEKILHVVSLS